MYVFDIVCGERNVIVIVLREWFFSWFVIELSKKVLSLCGCIIILSIK